MTFLLKRFTTLQIFKICNRLNLIACPAPLPQTRPFVALSAFFRGMSSIEYPETRRDGLVEDLHGFKVSDPYRFLEDPKSPETTVFISSTSYMTHTRLLLQLRTLFATITFLHFHIRLLTATGRYSRNFVFKIADVFF